MSDSAAGSAAVAAAPMGATAASASLTHTRTASSSAAAASAADSAGLRPSHAQAAQAAPASPGGSGGGSHSRHPSSSSAAASAAGGSGHPQLVALRKIDALSEKLQKEGKLLEALQCMEKSLILRGHIFGLDSVEVFRACKSVGEMANFLAMTFLQQDLFDVTLELLKKAEVLTERHKAVRAVTFNNLACYYRKRGKLRTALNYARKALGIEAKLAESNAAAAAAGGPDSGGSVVAVKSADTHLNMCTILSELKRHEKAIVHARIALKLLLLELFGDFDQLQKQEQAERQQQQQDGGGGSGDGQQQGSGATRGPAEHEQIATGSNPEVATDPASMARLRARLPPDRIAVLAIAYHNLAVQQEFLRKYPESLSSYEKATRVVTTHLGASHPLCASLAESYAAAQAKMQNKMARQKEHAAARAGGTGTSASASASTAKLDANRSARVDKQKQPQQQQEQQPELYLSPEQEQGEEEDHAHTDDGEYRDEEEAAEAAAAQEEYDRDAAEDEQEAALG